MGATGGADHAHSHPRDERQPRRLRRHRRRLAGLRLFPNFSPELCGIDRKSLLDGFGTIVMGRVNYEGQAATWPNAEGPLADTMNRVEKVVFSTTLRVRRLGELPAGDRPARGRARPPQGRRRRPVGASGGATFARYLTSHDLVDEFRFTVHPVVLGSGKPIFEKRVALEPTRVHGVPERRRGADLPPTARLTRARRRRHRGRRRSRGLPRPAADADPVGARRARLGDRPGATARPAPAAGQLPPADPRAARPGRAGGGAAQGQHRRARDAGHRVVVRHLARRAGRPAAGPEPLPRPALGGVAAVARRPAGRGGRRADHRGRAVRQAADDVRARRRGAVRVARRAGRVRRGAEQRRAWPSSASTTTRTPPRAGATGSSWPSTRAPRPAPTARRADDVARVRRPPRAGARPDARAGLGRHRDRTRA